MSAIREKMPLAIMFSFQSASYSQRLVLIRTAYDGKGRAVPGPLPKKRIHHTVYK
jgi:hypothetical protein